MVDRPGLRGRVGVAGETKAGSCLTVLIIAMAPNLATAVGVPGVVQADVVKHVLRGRVGVDGTLANGVRRVLQGDLCILGDTVTREGE